MGLLPGDTRGAASSAASDTRLKDRPAGSATTDEGGTSTSDDGSEACCARNSSVGSWLGPRSASNASSLARLRTRRAGQSASHTSVAARDDGL